MSFKCHSLVSVWNLFQSHAPTLFDLEWFSGVTLYFLSNVTFDVAFSSFVFNFVSSFSNFSFCISIFKRCQGWYSFYFSTLPPLFRSEKEVLRFLWGKDLILFCSSGYGEYHLFALTAASTIYGIFSFAISVQLWASVWVYISVFLNKTFCFLQWTHLPQLSWTSMKMFLTPTWLGNVRCS